MTEIDSLENNNNISSEDHQNDPNQEGDVGQNNIQTEFFTQDQTHQADDNPISKTEQENQQPQADSQLESIITNGVNILNPIEQSNSASSSSTNKPESPKQNQSPKTQQKKKVDKQSKSKKSEEPCNYTEEDLDEYIFAIVDKRSPPPRELRNPILQLLNRRRVQALVDGDYDYAEEQDNTIKAFNRVVQSQDNKSNENEQFEILFGRYQQLQKDYQEITEKWDEKINKYNEEEEQLYNELLKKQEEEKENYHTKWADPEKLRQFTKPSPKLNSMREQERAMAVARMYQQAKVMKQSADRLQKEETAAAQQRISKTMETEWNRMMERHEIERKKFVDHKNRNVAFLESEKQKELKPTLNALNQIKSKKGLLLSTKQSSATITKSAQEIEAQSPRTHKKYSDFKAEKKKPKLDVQPVTDQQMQSTKKSTKSKSRLSKTQSQKQSDESQKQNENENSQTIGNSDSQKENESSKEINDENQQNENLENTENPVNNENLDENKENNNDENKEKNENLDENKENDNDENKENVENKEKNENDNDENKENVDNVDQDKKETENSPDLFSKISDAVDNITQPENKDQSDAAEAVTQQENKDQLKDENDEGKVENNSPNDNAESPNT